jgi:hypothetical protein
MLSGRMLRVFRGMNIVALRQMRVVSGFLMIARFVLHGGLLMVARSMLMMFGCLLVMMGCLL